MLYKARTISGSEFFPNQLWRQLERRIHQTTIATRATEPDLLRLKYMRIQPTLGAVQRCGKTGKSTTNYRDINICVSSKCTLTGSFFSRIVPERDWSVGCHNEYSIKLLLSTRLFSVYTFYSTVTPAIAARRRSRPEKSQNRCGYTLPFRPVQVCPDR